MQIFKLSLFAAVALVLATLPGYAANAQHGLDLANRWCASCHLVTPEQKTANADAPPFATIARWHINPRALAYFLLDPHPKMPELPLTRPAADDIAAYIGSLRKSR